MPTRLVTGFGPLVSALLLISATAFAEPQDPPGRVGRLSFIEGAVQQRTADDADWTRAGLNYPVTNGFAVATREGGRAEIQVGSMAVRVGSDSELDVNTLDDTSATLTLAGGEISLRLGRPPEGGRIEIVTPRGVVDIVDAGQYHFDAGTTESPTRVAVFNGRAEVPRAGEPTVLSDGQAALITGDELSGIALADASADPLDDWASARDRSEARVAGRDHVSPEMSGGTDLDQYGDWRHDPRYGEVWYPAAVPEGWAPYRYGHWAWVSPWGWTWIDDEPWGFAPFHYGRWVNTYYGWGWVPGVVVDFPIFAPALVGFVGSPAFVGVGFQFVSWFPLAPFEVFVPAFPVSIAFVRRINITNVNITNINITRVNGNIVVNNVTNVTVNNFANRNFTTTVSTTTFTSGQSITRTALTQSATRIAWNAPVSSAPANVRAPRTSATVKGWQSGGAGTTAAKPPLPTARTTGGGSVAAGNAAGGTRTSAVAADPAPSRHVLPPLPSGGAAPTVTSGAASVPGGRAEAFGSPGGKAQTTAATVAPTGHKLPPLPRGPAPTTAATTAAGWTHTGGAWHHDAGRRVAPVPSMNPTQQGGSTAFNGNRVGPSSPPMMPSAHGTITPNGPWRQPNPAATAHGGPPAHAPVMPNGPWRQPNPAAMAHGGAPAHGMPMRGGPAAPPVRSGQYGGGWGAGQNRMHMNNG